MSLGKRASVTGGSLAGLLAARVLSGHFEEVVVFDRDQFPTEAADRKGVPQGRHAHALLSSGRRALAALFPAFVEELTAKRPLTLAFHTVANLLADPPSLLKPNIAFRVALGNLRH